MSTIAELLKLPPAERIALAETLWDSVLVSPEAAECYPLTPAQVAEIERRLEQHDGDPSTAIPWEAARRQIEQKLAR